MEEFLEGSCARASLKIVVVTFIFVRVINLSSHRRGREVVQKMSFD